jgi:hypothetical protein
MPNLPDYSNFVNAAYMISAIILLGFMAVSLFKFKKNSKKLANLKEDEKAKS